MRTSSDLGISWGENALLQMTHSSQSLRKFVAEKFWRPLDKVRVVRRIIFANYWRT